jgi:hypothetical protein
MTRAETMTTSQLSENDENYMLESNTCQNIQENAFDSVRDAMVNLIPSEEVKTFHPRYLYPFASIILLIMGGIFIQLFVTSYSNEITNRFLSPKDSGDSKYCDHVQISNTGTFYATKEGYWSGSSQFRYSNTSYAIYITNMAASEENFKSSFWEIYSSLSFLGNITKTTDLSINLLFWMSYAIFAPTQRNQRFTLHGNPLNVFDREKISGSIGGVFGNCAPNNSIASYSVASGILELFFSHDSFMDDPQCASLLTPEYIGYDPITTNNLLHLRFDVRTLVTSLAINIGILSLSSVEKIGNTDTSFPYEYEGIVYSVNVSKFYDPRYPGMKPVTCLVDSLFPSTCIIELYNIIALPVFRHRGLSNEYPLNCNCTEVVRDLSFEDPAHPCNVFAFLAGLLYYNNPNPAALFSLFVRNGFQRLHDASFEPLFVASAFGRSSPYQAYFDSAYMQKIYDFCASPSYGYCSFITFSLWDENDYNYAVNEYYYQLPLGACRDTLSTSRESWQKLIETPFAPLDQEYVVCRATTQNALINSVGVSASNLGILAPITVLLVLGCVYAYQRCTGRYVPRGYTQANKDEVLDQLAVLLLLVKNGKLQEQKQASIPGEQRLIALQFAKELQVLSRQLTKQYQPKTRGEHRPSIITANDQKGKGTEQLGPDEQEVVEMHYGHYELVSAQDRKSLSGVSTGADDAVNAGQV